MQHCKRTRRMIFSPIIRIFHTSRFITAWLIHVQREREREKGRTRERENRAGKTAPKHNQDTRQTHPSIIGDVVPEIGLKFVAALLNLSEQGRLPYGLERQATGQDGVHDHSHAPHVHRLKKQRTMGMETRRTKRRQNKRAEARHSKP